MRRELHTDNVRVHRYIVQYVHAYYRFVDCSNEYTLLDCINACYCKLPPCELFV